MTRDCRDVHSHSWIATMWIAQHTLDGKWRCAEMMTISLMFTVLSNLKIYPPATARPIGWKRFQVAIQISVVWPSLASTMTRDCRDVHSHSWIATMWIAQHTLDGKWRCAEMIYIYMYVMYVCMHVCMYLFIWLFICLCICVFICQFWWLLHIPFESNLEQRIWTLTLPLLYYSIGTLQNQMKQETTSPVMQQEESEQEQA